MFASNFRFSVQLLGGISFLKTMLCFIYTILSALNIQMKQKSFQTPLIKMFESFIFITSYKQLVLKMSSLLINEFLGF